MKNNYYLSFLLFICCYCLSFGQTVLTNGDIVITGFNSDDPDQFSFVLLTDILTTTEIKFTDNGWQASGSFRPNEGTLTWTATSNLACGTEIIVDDQSPFVVSTGIITENGNFRLAAAGDQILAYQGLDVNPTFLYAVNFESSGWADATTSNTTAIPVGLTDGNDAVNLGDTDNAKYNCSVLTDPSLILEAVSTASNWDVDDTTPYIMGGCTYICSLCSSTTTWNGPILGWDNGIPNSTTEAIINDDYDTSVGGVQTSFIACILTVNSGFNLDIQNGTYIEIQNNIVANGNINVATEGSVVQVDDAGTVSGTGTIEVTKLTAPMNNWYEYTYWSSPTANTTIDEGLTEGSPNRRFKFEALNFVDTVMETNNNNTYVSGQDDIDDNGDDWTLVNGADMMLPGYGYASTHRSDLFFGPPMSSPPYQFAYTFTGPFNNGIINVPVYRNDTETADNNWNFIGNPYPSAIDIDAFFSENVNLINASGLLDGTVYLWSQNSEPSNTENGNEGLNFVQSDYASINGTGETQGGDDINGDGTVDINDRPNRFIPSGQGFFVSFSDTPATSSGNVIFNNSMRVTGSNDQFFRNTSQIVNEDKNRVWLNLTTDNGVFSQMLVGYINGATNDFDGTYYDAPRNLSTGAYSVLYSTIENNNKKFAIQGKDPNSLNENEVITLGFYTAIETSTIYSISIAQFEGQFLTQNDIYLKDNLLNTLHNLKESDYNFTSEVGEFNERFEIVFKADTLSVDTDIINPSQLIITELSNGDVQIKVNSTITITKTEILDLLGRQVYTLLGNSSTETYNLSKLSKAPYIARITLSNGQVISKKAIKRK